jgi:hypothetical protein
MHRTEQGAVTEMQRLPPTVVRYGLLTIILTSSDIAHCDKNAYLKWAASHAVPLATIDPTEDLSDLLPLKSVISTASVVALGETTHGAGHLSGLLRYAEKVRSQQFRERTPPGKPGWCPRSAGSLEDLIDQLSLRSTTVR